MNAVVVRLTLRSLLGARRVLVLAGLPLVLLGLAVLVRVFAGSQNDISAAVVLVFGLGTVTPLLGLIAGTGAIGPEIGDGSIIYLLAKPLRRGRIVASKLVTASIVAILFAALPIYVAGVILTGTFAGLASAAAIGSAVAAVAYCALFLLLAIITRNAVVIGLLYALVWESLLGQFLPGAQQLSVQQWALSIAERLLGEDASYFNVNAAVDLSTGVIMLVIVIALAVWQATARLCRLRLSNEE